ncbi:RecX family transcriptional regulator [Candidatus Saccharibacteria bacterium]|nr:RecX family transcriptional regulator [Candidatus Saccharibacteria bacterium]
MKITDIKQQVKRKDRYSIFIDGKYSFALSEGKLLELGLAIGQEFDKTQLETAKDEAHLDKAVYSVMDLISRRPRSGWEIKDYLKRKGYEASEIEQVVKLLSEKGYVNDLDFARRWVESRRLLKSTSKRKLRLELMQKRVSEEAITKVLEDDETDEAEVLEELIAKKRSQTRYQDREKLIAYLLRQGFNYSDIKSVIGFTD